MADVCVMKVYDRRRRVMADVLLDPEDYERFTGLTWRIDEGGYVRRTQWISGKTKTFLLHRCVLNVEWQSAAETCVDHINGNKLDNRKANLRIVSYAQNAANRHAVLTSTGLLNVSKYGSSFLARVRIDGKPVFVGSFSGPNEAERAVKLFKETGQLPYKKREQRRVQQKTLTGEVLATYASCAEASRITGVCAVNIARVANHDRRRKQAGGFVWDYAS